jgi:hypothetical protein
VNEWQQQFLVLALLEGETNFLRERESAMIPTKRSKIANFPKAGQQIFSPQRVSPLFIHFRHGSQEQGPKGGGPQGRIQEPRL